MTCNKVPAARKSHGVIQFMKFSAGTISVTALIAGMLFAVAAQAEEEFSDRIQGDVGAAVYAGNNPVKSDSNTVIAIPYVFFDYGRFFARFDTFGFKTLPMGYGHLEIVGRISLDGYRTNNSILRGISERRSSLPLGIGTFQETPIGGFFMNVFYDVNRSHGRLSELIYAGEFNAGNTVLYPLIGLEHFSAQYTRYFYGVSPVEAANSNYPAYSPKATTTTMLGLAWEVPVAADWNAQVFMSRRWLGSAISLSPLVHRNLQDEAFISLSYRYK